MKKFLNISEGGVFPKSLEKIPDPNNKSQLPPENDDNLGINLNLFKTADFRSKKGFFEIFLENNNIYIVLESKKIDFTKMLTENPDIKLTSNMKSLLTSGVTNYFDSKSQNYIDNNNMNKSSFTIKTQNDIMESEETNNITTNLDVTIMKVKQLETKLANKSKEAQTLQLHSQKLEKEIFQVFFNYFKII